MMFKLILALILFPIFCTAEDSSFHQGLNSYKSENYEEAIEFFDKALQEQPNPPEILYNLGLALKKSENEAKAIALWRKTLALDPSYTQAENALKFVQKINPPHNTLWESYRSNILTELPFNLLLALLTLCLSFFGFSLISYLKKRKKAESDEFAESPNLPLKTILWSFALLFALCLNITKAMDFFESRGTLVEDNVSLLVSPSKDSLELLKIQAGLEVVIRKNYKGWTQIKIPGGPAGWIKSEEIFKTHGRQLL